MAEPDFDAPPATTEYTYTTPGVYKVKLTFRSDYGSYTTPEGTVHVVGELVPPTAQFDVTSSAPQVGEPVEFDASGSQGGSGKITGYEWNWGDGSSESLAGTATAAHTYAKAGPYTVKLVVTDNLGQKSVVDSQEVVVASAGNPVVGGTTTTPNPGNTGPPTITTGGGKTSTVKPLTDTQKLALALKACKKKPKKQRASCEKQARKKYSPKPKKKAKKKKK